MMVMFFVCYPGSGSPGFRRSLLIYDVMCNIETKYVSILWDNYVMANGLLTCNAFACLFIGIDERDKALGNAPLSKCGVKVHEP
jgi:hypothetical protein